MKQKSKCLFIHEGLICSVSNIIYSLLIRTYEMSDSTVTGKHFCTKKLEEREYR